LTYVIFLPKWIQEKHTIFLEKNPVIYYSLLICYNSLSPAFIGKMDAWEKWYVGQTGAIIEGKFVMYGYDITRFLRGLPDFDLM
jgi:hypothetical protein